VIASEQIVVRLAACSDLISNFWRYLEEAFGLPSTFYVLAIYRSLIAVKQLACSRLFFSRIESTLCNLSERALSRSPPPVLLALAVSAATPDEWRKRAIYQVLTDRFALTNGSTMSTCNTQDRIYCGGSWQGVINHLDYIQDMGFTAIWISPVTLNLPQDTPYGEAYHGYWQRNINALNSNFGTTDDFKELSNALHAHRMYLMVDVVVNHFGWDGNVSTVDCSQFVPFNSSSYFHSYYTISQDHCNSRD
jgi:hypothetical protein